MPENTVEIGLKARDDASGVINGVIGNLRGLVVQIAATAGITGLAAGLVGLAKKGVEFNRVMEDSRSGIASLILANNTLTDSFGKTLPPAAALAQAFKIATGVQAELRQAALTTAASYEELVRGFQTAYGPASAAGITSLSKIKTITVSAAQAVAALGLNTAQTSQEIRSLFTGEQGPDNALVRTLKISKEEMDALRASGGDVGDYLIGKLKPFADVASASLGNFSTVVSNLGDALDQVAGTAFASLFREIRAQAAGMGGALGSFEAGLTAIGDGLAQTLRAVGPLLQAIAGLGLAAFKAGTDFVTALLPILPALTDIVRGTAAVVDALGPLGIAALLGAKYFGTLATAANAALYGMIGLSATADAAIVKLIATISTATLGWVALGAAIVAATGYLIKWSYESDADDAWKRAADAQVTYIAVLEKKYGVTIEANAAEELLNVSMKDRAAIMERVLKADKDHVVSQDDVRSAMAALTEETLKANQANTSLLMLQEKTKASYRSFVAALEAEVKIGGLDGLRKALAEVEEEFRKRREKLKEEFFDPVSKMWAQDPGKPLGLLSQAQQQATLAAIQKFAKGFEAAPVEIVGTWDAWLQKIPEHAKTYYAAAAAVTLTETQKMRADLLREADAILGASKFSGRDPAPSEAAAAQAKVMAAQLPAAFESAARAVEDIWRGMTRAFDDIFASVLTGRLDDVGRALEGWADSLARTFSSLVADMIQRAIAGTEKIAEGWKKLNDSMKNQSGGLSVEGGLMAAGTGYAIGGSIGQGTQANQIGAAAGAVVGAIVLSAIPVVGTIIGAIVGGLIGELFNKNTESKYTSSIGGMVGATSWWKRPIYDPTKPSGPAGRDDGEFDPGTPIGYEDVGTLQSPTTSFERAGQKAFEAQTATFADIFRKGAASQARDLIGAYQKSLKEMLSGAWVTIAAGSQEDIEKDAERVIKELLPKIGLSAAFGQTGYLPHGNRDVAGGMAGISWGMPGMNPNGDWEGAKTLFDPEAPIPKMLAGLGVTADRIGEIAARISTDDPKALLAYIGGLVDVLVEFKRLKTEMGKTVDEIWAGWDTEKAGGPTAAIAKAATEVAGLFDSLDLYSGDEQIEKAKEAQKASAALWESVLDYLAKLKAMADQMSSALTATRTKMRELLFPQTETERIAGATATIDAGWGKLLAAKTAEEAQAVADEMAGAVDAIFQIMAERIVRGRALIESLGALSTKLGSISLDVENERLEKSNPLRKWGMDLTKIQNDVAKAATLSGIAQIDAIEGVKESAAALYQNLKGLLSEIAATGDSVRKSISSQIWELGVGEMDPKGQATAITERIAQLQAELEAATSPAEIQAITAEIQSLTGRYVGTFEKDDPNRQKAIDWARQQLEETGALAQAALDQMRKQALAQAAELDAILKGATTMIATNVDLASTAIKNLSFTLGELDRVFRDVLKGLGTAALDALGPAATAASGALDLLTGASGATTESFTGEVGLETSARSTATALDDLTTAIRSTIGALGSGAPAGSESKSGAASSYVVAAPTAREIVPVVKRYAASLTPRTA